MELKGQVTISIEDFEKLKAEVENKEKIEKQFDVFRDKMSQFYEIEDSEFLKKLKEIDDTPMTDKQVKKALSEARKTLKIIIDINSLKKIIRSLINEENYSEDDTHIDLKNATNEELKEIEICFRE